MAKTITIMLSDTQEKAFDELCAHIHLTGMIAGTPLPPTATPEEIATGVVLAMCIVLKGRRS